MSRTRVRRGGTVVAVLAACLATMNTAPATAAEKTRVDHGITFTVDFPDDACGPRANTVAMTYKTIVLRETHGVDGTYQFHEVIRGTYHTDFVDPAIPDADGAFTEVNVFRLTPGGTRIVTQVGNDHLDGVRITFRLHLTIVDGDPVVEREVFAVTGCP